MNGVVIDAGVAFSCLVEGEQTAKALTLMRENEVVLAPEMLLVEVASALWKHVRFAAMPAAHASELLQSLRSWDTELTPTADLTGAAFAIACETGCGVYDALYVALARVRGATLVSLDRKLVHRLAPTPYGRVARVL